MFPNLRLLTAALLATVVALCCGFAGFAAFGVNHEPLGRLPTDTAALQLVTEIVHAPQTWNEPYARQAEAAQIASIAANAPVTVPVRRAAIEPSVVVAPHPATLEVIRQVAPQPASPPTPIISLAPPTATPHADTFGAPSESQGPATPATTAAKPGRGAVPPMPVKTNDGAAQIATVETPAAKPAAEIAKLTPKPKPLRKIARKSAGRHRVAVKRRVVRRTPAPTVARVDKESFDQPVFRSAPSFAPQAQNQTGKKSAASGAPTDPFAWPDAR